jgi:hypothetical protein
MFSYAVNSLSRLGLTDDAERAADGGWIAPRIVAGNLDASAGRREQRRQHLDRGRLAGSVRSQEREDLAALDGETDVVDRRDGAELLGELFRTNDTHGGRPCAARSVLSFSPELSYVACPRMVTSLR